MIFNHLPFSPDHGYFYKDLYFFWTRPGPLHHAPTSKFAVINLSTLDVKPFSVGDFIRIQNIFLCDNQLFIRVRSGKANKSHIYRYSLVDTTIDMSRDFDKQDCFCFIKRLCIWYIQRNESHDESLYIPSVDREIKIKLRAAGHHITALYPNNHLEDATKWVLLNYHVNDHHKYQLAQAWHISNKCQSVQKSQRKVLFQAFLKWRYQIKNNVKERCGQLGIIIPSHVGTLRMSGKRLLIPRLKASPQLDYGHKGDNVWIMGKGAFNDDDHHHFYENSLKRMDLRCTDRSPWRIRLALLGMGLLPDELIRKIAGFL